MITSAEEFVRFRTSDKQEEHSRAAREEATEAVWLDVIARFPEMKTRVVHNKTVPHRILQILSDDPDYNVRCWVAMKRKAGPEILAKLAQDPSEGVRSSVGYNRKAPLWVLERLACDPILWIAEIARERIATRTAKALRPQRLGDRAVAWDTCRENFAWDGSLRDIYVLNTNLGDWQRLLDLLREWKLPMVFEVGGSPTPLPDDVAGMFAGPDDASRTLTVSLHGMQLNSHFFVDYEIELDLDPREVQDETAFGHLLDFMGGVARRLDKAVILTPENLQDIPIVTMPPSGSPI